MKICPQCGIEKSIEDFRKRPNRKDGLDYWCKECAKFYNKIYFQKNADKIREYVLLNAERIKARMREYGIKYRQKNADKIREKKKRYYESYYKEASRERNARYERERRKFGKINRLNKNMSLAIWRSLEGNKNGNHWEELVGYTLEDLKQHLELQFKDGMNWENYGKTGWEIDHKIPISLFNIDGEKSKGFKRCWALENLQPKWQRDNAMKRDKLFVA